MGFIPVVTSRRFIGEIRREQQRPVLQQRIGFFTPFFMGLFPFVIAPLSPAYTVALHPLSGTGTVSN